MHNDDGSRTLPGTSYLSGTADYGRLLLAGISSLLDRRLVEADRKRRCLLTQSKSPTDIRNAVIERRQKLARCIGVVDTRLPIEQLEVTAQIGESPIIAETAHYNVMMVRWPVLPGVDGEGLLIEPRQPPVANVIALPDADWSPEVIAGIMPDLPTPKQYARRLADSGCRVVVPTLINRDCRWSGNPAIRMTNQPHREYIYRMAYQMGRHIIGYETQKVLAVAELFKKQSPSLPLILFGYGEGGLLVLSAAALDERIDAAGVSGYFADQTEIWQEPIYRNVWQLLQGCSDAELAACVAPRPILIENAPGPVVLGPPPETADRKGAAPGVLRPISEKDARTEFELARLTYSHLGVSDNIHFVQPQPDEGPGCERALVWLLQACSVKPTTDGSPDIQVLSYRQAWVEERQRRQFQQLVHYTQELAQNAAVKRIEFWQQTDDTSPEAWIRSTRHYRRYFHAEVIGVAPPLPPLREARSRLIETTIQYRLYEVVLDLWDEVPAFAYLLTPVTASAGNPAPVVVCQHGLAGDPAALLQAGAYRRMAEVLATRGYIALVPQNPVVGPAGDFFRVLQRKANPLGMSIFSFVIAVHQRWLTWLGTQTYADKNRIALYGLSYGGKTALRVPAVLPEYALAICSGDFMEWIVKTVSTDFSTSYMFTGEYEIPEFNLGHTFNHAEMAYLIAPRPFMVERGHADPCGEDAWVEHEYVKVKRLYDKLGIPQNTHMEYFAGGHRINLQGTMEFIEKHLGPTVRPVVDHDA
ncbi:MAG TPA: prolyl oligopeptidase family serine peptidase [Firmicutes bacterium]|nr:prolyl oligopeptidase family serine peptidase [Bacillota bacterium]